MSSWIGHALVGIALGKPLIDRNKKAGIIVSIALSIAPDVDMFVPFMEHPRATHGILFAAVVAAIAAWVWRKRIGPAPILPFVLVALSHVALDMLVGVNAFHLLWPISELGVQLPFGVLPSAPSPTLHPGPVAIRNLVLETMTLLPIALAVHAKFESRTLRALMVSISIVGASIGSTLQR